MLDFHIEKYIVTYPNRKTINDIVLLECISFQGCHNKYE